MNVIRYLTFEINQTCPNTALHMGKCPISHPERYKFSTSNKLLSKDIIMEFWRWSRYKGFRGIVLWHMYNEPVLVLEKIRKLMKTMRLEDIYQPFQLTTSIKGNYTDFNIVKFSDYGKKRELELDGMIKYRIVPSHVCVELVLIKILQFLKEGVSNGDAPTRYYGSFFYIDFEMDKWG